jgi:RND family efflux transporter MFP subunit
MADQLSSDLAALRIERTAVRRPGGSWVGRIIAVLLLGGVGVGAYVVGVPYLEAKVFKTEVEVTEVALVSPAQASVELTSTGYVVAQSVSKVAAKFPGKVVKSNVKEGVHVNSGDVLFELDPVDVKAAIATASSQVAAAKAQAQTARATLAEARVQLTRAQAMAKDGIGPKATAEDLETHVTSLEEMVKASDASAKAASAQVAALNVTLGSYKVIAPLSGTVVNKPPEVGEMVAPQPAGIAVDMGGVEIADFDTLEVETDVPEQRLSQVKVGGPCEIVLDAYPTKRFRGKAVEITPRVNRTKATVVVKVAFVDDREGVLPDMAARVSFLSSELDKAELKQPPKTIVPSEAVATLGGAKVVYVIDDGKVRATPIELGPAFGSGFEVVRGPGAGTKLVKSPPTGLADGQRVKEKDQS